MAEKIPVPEPIQVGQVGRLATHVAMACRTRYLREAVRIWSASMQWDGAR
jgi:hypothetical protein